MDGLPSERGEAGFLGETFGYSGDVGAEEADATEASTWLPADEWGLVLCMLNVMEMVLAPRSKTLTAFAALDVECRVSAAPARFSQYSGSSEFRWNRNAVSSDARGLRWPTPPHPAGPSNASSALFDASREDAPSELALFPNDDELPPAK